MGEWGRGEGVDGGWKSEGVGRWGKGGGVDGGLGVDGENGG